MRSYTMILCVPLLAIGCGREPAATTESEPELEVKQSPTLQSYINDLQAGDERARLTAALGLGVMGRQAKPAIPAMIVALRDTNKYVRTLIAWSLVYVDPMGEEVLAPLCTATWDSEFLVRQKAAEALGKIGPPAYPAVPELIRLLKDPFPTVRGASAQAQGQIGKGALEARPYLEAVAEDDIDDKVRQAAGDAVKWIDLAVKQSDVK